MSANDERLAGLMEEIERAWMEDGDESVVDRLAKENPELAERLYLFFATVIDAPDQLERHRPELAEGAARTRDWLEREGFARAAQGRAMERPTEATPTPTGKGAEPATPTFVGLLRQETGADPQQLAAELGITLDFLAEVSTNARVLPIRVRRELASRAHRTRGIGLDRALASLEGSARLQRAASRGSAYSDASVTYEVLVSQSQLSPDQKEYWRDLGRDPADQQGGRDAT